ncbi:hypothetical protein BX616_003923 [Lobosporangium transversale]|uniref:Ricin B lectin domain-containing protein n=1 Tax=Lobosporangium transversale TaxID=64571 RepID=A0A1Y2GKZ6_9FUNG|nr:hypothetical protein BCR41DRAFT_355185 [Lobosporangium transversale]KAF9916372.1 hypothetical protein BX616_003923 [Lobosporangium transversale]ORZ13924.1 hypothetical protein BCR41DRAFT_355185 [Lobosporangium transversale]|eukprot:XP_021880708.1 hypothetical protein BCR41DRAFT_355185 [Lobosporangium transversale]
MVRSTAFLIGALAMMQAAMAMTDGQYRIKQGTNFITANISTTASNAYLAPLDASKDQIWELKRQPGDDFYFSSPKTGRHIGIDKFDERAPIVIGSQQQRWKLWSFNDEYQIVHPDKYGEEDLTIGSLNSAVVLRDLYGAPLASTVWYLVRV